MAIEDFIQDPRHIRLVQWLCQLPQDREPSTQVALADEIGVSPRTLRDWRGRDDVRRDWKQEAEHIVGDPTNVQEVLEGLRQTALDPTHRQYAQSAKLYLEAVKAIQPPEQNVSVKISQAELAEWTDSELNLAIAKAIAESGMTVDSP